MDLLKKYLPKSFGLETLKDLAIAILIYIAIDFVGGIVCAVLGIVPFIGDILAWAVGTVCGIYTLAGIVCAVLSFLKVID